MKHQEWQKIIHSGKARADRTSKTVLVSSVSALDSTDPISFFSLEPSTFAGTRVFWSDAERETTFVGLGRALLLESPGVESRFQDIDRQWQEIVADSLVTPDAPEFTGPLLFGGFSFDPLKPRTELWRQFPHTRFVVPQYMLTIAGGKSWLTVNRLVTPGAEEAEEVDAFAVPAEIPASKPVSRLPVHAVLTEEIAPAHWMKSVEEAAESIRQGELEKVVLARELRLRAGTPFSVAEVLERLYHEQKETYVFAFEEGEDCFLGATPERLVKSSGNQFLSTCLAGSIARGKTEAEDRKLGGELLQDDKNLHEHALVVRMIVEAMSQVCEAVDFPESPMLCKLKDIQHLCTPVKGQAKRGVSILKVVEALHPTPALGGFPRQEAVNLIRRVEQMDRGWYAAPIGWINRKMDGEFAVAIRSGLIQGNEASLFAGCGIVCDSDPLGEYNETGLKFRPMLSALQAMDQDA
jgi:menaquinone-specific isochorismate synthase